MSAAVAGAPSAGGEYGQGGEGASTNASGAGGAAGSGFEAAGAPAGGMGGLGLGGEGGAGAKPLECDADAVRLLSVSYSGGVYDSAEDLNLELEYDAAGRLVQVGGPSPYPFTYSYDDQSRIQSVSSSMTDGAGYSLTYESDRIRYQNDDMSMPPPVELSGRRWLRTDVSISYRKSVVPTWSDGLITAITTDSTNDALDALETFTYELDDLGYPTRLIPSDGPAPPTEEVYDASGHHLFQLVRTAGGQLSGVRLYRDNADPVRSLLESVYPQDAVDNLWLWAGFDPSAERGVVGDREPQPLDLVPWRPLSLSAEEASDFAVDVDGNGSVDVAGNYELDARARLTSFVLQLEGVPRVVLSLKYTPNLVTETIAYPGSTQPEDVRRYSYGCIELSP